MTLDRKKLQDGINLLYRNEHDALGEEITTEILEKGKDISNKYNLTKALQDGGMLVFPHTSVNDCGYQVAACVNAALDSGAKKVVVISVLHAFSEEMEIARQKVAAGADPRTFECWGIQSKTSKRKEWQRDHALMSWRYFWNAEVSRRKLKNPPEVFEYYPYLAGGKPEQLLGIEELKEFAKDAVVVSTADAFHHGIGYGDLPQDSFEPDETGLKKAKAIIQEGADILANGDYWGYNQHCVKAKSDARDAGQVFRYIRGPMKAEIVDISFSDASKLYNAPAPTWVLGAIFKWIKI